ncbi:MAG: aryl-sulfate sulfotransferase [Acidobacteria bacterium]|nr:aryl-sulfate sulfotransferase [Acidobacteriota bacterium]
MAAPADLPDPSWVRIYDPEKVWNGYTLTLHQRRVPVLLDMNGRSVHAWPEARIKSRVRLLPDGSILGIGLGRQVVEYSWSGAKTWEFETPGAFPHHDIQRLANGNTWVIVKEAGEPGDTLWEISREGQVVWTWRATEHLRGLLPASPGDPQDVTHLNSVQELPENPNFAAGDERFRPGNLLLSARNLDTVFVVDRTNGKVVWSFAEGLDHQHEALMNGPAEPFPGRIQVLNNRRRSFANDRQSEVLELDPRNGGVAWRFRTPGFFTATGGTQQALPNGNVLITSTRGRRVFEVTREGEVVWQWAPSYQTVRALRVAPDACPQLPGLRARRTRAVAPTPGYLHVDPEAYRFARRNARRTVEIEGTPRTVLKRPRDCRRLFLPAEAELRLAFGVDRQRWRRLAPEQGQVVFRAEVREASEGSAVELLREVVTLEGPSWQRRSLTLASYGLRPVELCVSLDDGRDSPARGERFAFWEQPVIVDTSANGEGEPEEEGAASDLTPEEREVQRQHLKSLGYVD